MASSLPNISKLSDFASSVLPTPVGPTKMNDGGLFVLFNPARLRRIALETASTADCCPTTLLCKFSSKFKSFCVSASVIFLTGILVQLSITSAISCTVKLFNFNLLFNSSICSIKLHSLVFNSAAFW